MTQQELELYPSEINELKIAMAQLQREFSDKPDTKENLLALKARGEEIFNRAGFVVQIDVSTIDLAADNSIIHTPTIELIDRVKPEEFHDHERHAAEVQAGLADGIVGGIDQHGNMTEPNKLM